MNASASTTAPMPGREIRSLGTAPRAAPQRIGPAGRRTPPSTADPRSIVRMRVERCATPCRFMGVCLLFYCLFPYPGGGAEGWSRNVGERLVAAGHEVDYLTLRQWDGPR